MLYGTPVRHGIWNCGVEENNSHHFKSQPYKTGTLQRVVFNIGFKVTLTSEGEKEDKVMCVTTKLKTLALIGALLLSSNLFAQSGLYSIFDASQESYIDLGEASKLDCLDTLSNGDSMTITLWVRWTDLDANGVGNWANLFTASDSTGSGDNGVWWVQHNSNNTRFEFALHTNSRSFIQSTTNPVEGQWYHLAMTYDGSQMKLYVDGTLEASQNKSGNIRQFPNRTKLNIGRWSNSGNDFRKFHGNIDEISVWRCALNQTQIDSMMNNPMGFTGAQCDTNGLLGFWNFDQNTADDLTPCGNHGIVGSGAALPVDLLSFNVSGNNEVVHLSWETASELNNAFFTVERSTNGRNWEVVSRIDGVGNSMHIESYESMDVLGAEGLYYYRLSQTNFDGTTTYFDIRSYAWNYENRGALSVYPNPAKDWITIQINRLESNVQLIDALGRNVNNQVTAIPVSDQQIRIDMRELPNGLYTVQTTQGSRKIVKR